MKNRYQTLLLDYGGVYAFDYNPQDTLNALTESFGIEIGAKELEGFEVPNELFGEGRISTQEYIEQVSKALGTDRLPSVELLEKELLQASRQPNKVMVNLVKEARDNGIKVALASDVFKFEVTFGMANKRYDLFDQVFLSTNVGMTKRKPEFFNEIVKAMGGTPESVLFVDDSKYAITTAHNCGFNTLLATKADYASADELAKAIRNELSI